MLARTKDQETHMTNSSRNAAQLSTVADTAFPSDTAGRNHSPLPLRRNESEVAGNSRRCVPCGLELVEISLAIDGEDITMRSCSSCDSRSWYRGEEEISLRGILSGISSAPTRYRRDLASR
ncbi:MAG TPA: hypothetical protein DEG43_17225 [Acidimicrobiaceae bacterium]|jgi:hypothetical protein|nr:hypothetical protein [Acidimicrobiaceae bacterium]